MKDSARVVRHPRCSQSFGGGGAQAHMSVDDSIPAQDRVHGVQHVFATRGWKLLLLLPRMILFRPPRGGNVSREKLESRIVAFHEGRMELPRERGDLTHTTSSSEVS